MRRSQRRRLLDLIDQVIQRRYPLGDRWEMRMVAREWLDFVDSLPTIS